MALAERVHTSSAEHKGLRREVGLVGLTWASMGSIIGSGWLFGAQKALVVAGPAAIISWVIGGVVILVLALVHAELGGMYPVSGGTARFPHYAFGGFAGASFGWFSWLQAATVAPIEVSAMITYGQHYSFAHGWLRPRETGVLTTSGLVVAILLMAFLTSINFLGIRKLAAANSAATWWKVAVPLLTIFVLALANFHTSNFTAANGFNPDGANGILAAVSTGGIIFSYLGFEQADQLAGESKNPRRDIPIAHHRLDRARHHHLHRPADRVPRRAAGERDRQHLVGHGRRTTPCSPDRSREIATLVGARLAGGDPVRRRDHLARPAPA